MFNIGGGEVLVILLIALIVLGPDKLPNAARQAGKYLGDFRRMSSGFQRELRDAMDLGDLGDLMSGTSKPQSAGGPTAQPVVPPAADNPPTVTPGADTTPLDPSPPTTATTEPTATANGTNGTRPGAASIDGGASTSASSTTNGSSSGSPAGGAAPAVVRKRPIEVDGPSASFD